MGGETSAAEPLRLHPRRAVVGVDESLSLWARGGSPPYTFSLTGGGTVVGSSYRAPSSGSSTVQVTVRDATGNLSQAAIEVYDPRDDNALLLWLQSTALSLSDGAAVAKWPDRSGKGHDANQVSVSAQPTFRTAVLAGRAGLFFDGDDNLATALMPPLGSAPRTLVAVIFDGEPEGVTTQVLSYGGASQFYDAYGLAFQSTPQHGNNSANLGGDYHCSHSAGNGCFVSSKIPTRAPMVLVLSHDGTTDRLHVNGREEGSLAVTLHTRGSDPLKVGSSMRDSEFFKGAITEVLVFEDAIGDDHRQLLECYLGTKFGITIDSARHCGAQPLALLQPEPMAIQVGTSIAVATAGGEAPLRFSLASGEGTVDAKSGLYLASTTPGQATVRVEDALGAHVELAVDIVSIPRPEIWLDAGKIPDAIDGEPLFEWPDISGHGHHLRGVVAAQQPQYLGSGFSGRPIVRFSGDDMLRSHVTPALSDEPRAIFIVLAAHNAGSPGPQTLFSYGGRQQCHQEFTLVASSHLTLDYRCDSFASSAMPTTPKVLTTHYDGTSLSIYADGTMLGSQNISLKTSPAFGLSLGMDLKEQQPLAGDIAEVLVYGRLLSPSERAQVENYLLQKYGLGGN